MYYLLLFFNWMGLLVFFGLYLDIALMALILNFQNFKHYTFSAANNFNEFVVHNFNKFQQFHYIYLFK